MLAVDRATALVDEMLAKVDTSSMAYAVEARVPYLADGVLMKAKGVGANDKRIGDRGKVLLRDWFRELGPPGGADRPKTGFNSPLRAWLDGSAREYLAEEAGYGARLLDLETMPTSARLLFALAVIGAWNRAHAATGIAAKRRAS